MAASTRYPDVLNQLGWSLTGLATAVVVARCYSRAIIARNFTLDDGCMVIALIAGIVMMALISAGVHHGYGLHLHNIQDPYDRKQALMYTYIAPTISILASTLGKISMVLFLVHLLGQSPRKIYAWLLYSVTAFMVAGNVVCVGILLGGCMPIQKSWNPSIAGSCIDPKTFTYVGRIQSAWNAFMDLITATFPAYMVWKLQLKQSTKWSLTFLMCGGLCAASATFAKIWYMQDMSEFTDITFAWAPISACYIAEVFILIIAGSLPRLRPVVRLCCGNGLSEQGLFAGFKKSSGHSTTTSPYGGTTVAGMTGWELTKVEAERPRDGSGDLTVLPPRRSSAVESMTSSQASATPEIPEAQSRHSLGIITVQQEFEIVYERRPKDSMSLESQR